MPKLKRPRRLTGPRRAGQAGTKPQSITAVVISPATIAIAVAVMPPVVVYNPTVRRIVRPEIGRTRTVNNRRRSVINRRRRIVGRWCVVDRGGLVVVVGRACIAAVVIAGIRADTGTGDRAQRTAHPGAVAAADVMPDCGPDSGAQQRAQHRVRRGWGRK